MRKFPKPPLQRHPCLPITSSRRDEGQLLNVGQAHIQARLLRAAAGQVSPDGTRIAFAPEVGTLIGSTIGDSPRYSREVWVMGSQGDKVQEVLSLGESEGLWSLHWSPDGNRLAYIRARHSPKKGFRYGLRPVT